MPRILVVDDEPEILRLMNHILDVGSYQVRTASSGAEAIKLAGEWRPDLAIVDVMMPGMGGLATIMELRRSRPELRVIVMTGHVPEEAGVLGEIASSFGSSEVLRKPFTIEELRALVSAAVGPPSP
ncbi:response regulator [Salinispira pacifica]